LSLRIGVSSLSLRSAGGAVAISSFLHRARGLPRRFAPRKDGVFVIANRRVEFVIAKRRRRCGNLVLSASHHGIAASACGLLAKTVELSSSRHGIAASLKLLAKTVCLSLRIGVSSLSLRSAGGAVAISSFLHHAKGLPRRSVPCNNGMFAISFLPLQS